MRRLTARLKQNPDWQIEYADLNRTSRKAASAEMAQHLTRQTWDLVYQESTGISAGLPLIQAAKRTKLKYIISSGDPIEPFFRVTKGPLIAAPFGVYERALYKNAQGFVGWTPYLVGRALELGAPCGVTIEGAVDPHVFEPLSLKERQSARERFGLTPGHIVCGVVGSMKWVARQNYCYGLELVEAALRVTRPDVSFLLVGDGDGRAMLEAKVPQALRSRVVFTGRLPEAEVVQAMNAMDVGFITQTLDTLGSFRLTTKMPEYLACGLPVAVSPVPGYYDYIGEAGWALPAHHPASPLFHEQCARWIDQLTRAEIHQKSRLCRDIATERFAYNKVTRRFEAFLHHVLNLPPQKSSDVAEETLADAPVGATL
jgi:hypothetical protein